MIPDVVVSPERAGDELAEPRDPHVDQGPPEGVGADVGLDVGGGEGAVLVAGEAGRPGEGLAVAARILMLRHLVTADDAFAIFVDASHSGQAARLAG